MGTDQGRDPPLGQLDLGTGQGLFRAIFENSLEAMAITSSDGRIFRANAEACRVLRMSEQEICEAGRAGLVDESDPRLPLALEERRRTGQYQGELIYKRKDGTRFPAEFSSAVFRDEQGQEKTILVFRDITERKQALEALQRSEARLAQAVRVAGLGTFEHDHLTNAIDCSPVLREMCGFGPNAPVTLAEVVDLAMAADRQRVAAAIQRAHDPAGDGTYEIEYRIVLPDQRICWVSVRSQTFFEGEGPERRPVRTIGAVRDITARKEFEAELERLVAERTAKLEELVKELRHVSYSLVHDMRAPLRAIQSYAGILEARCGEEVRQRNREFFQRIAAATDRMDLQITDALQYTKAVLQEAALKPVPLGRLVRQLVEGYPGLQPDHAEIQIEGELPVVLGNESLLTQCFSNLLGNAVKFVVPGTKPRIRVWSEGPKDGEAGAVEGNGSRGESQASQDDSGRVRIWVEDNGIGIPKDSQERVFGMFERVSGSYEGTGIGLAIVRKVVERMGGRVGVDSELDHGSRFWVELQTAKQPIA